MTNSVAVGRDRASWPALFSYGFRPFFLGAAIYAVIAMVVWIGWILLPSPPWAPFTGLPLPGTRTRWCSVSRQRRSPVSC